MIWKSRVLGLFVMLSSLGGFAQQSAVFTRDVAQFENGLKLYRQSQYAAAQHIFDQLHQTTKDEELEAKTAYYSALSAVKLNRPHAGQKMRDFVNNYPESVQINSAYNQVADSYFQQKEYKKAAKWLQKTDPDQLSVDEKDIYYFNRGYTAFKSGNRQEAKHYFEKVRYSKAYAEQAKYYLGYLAYENNDFKEADRLFQGVSAPHKSDRKVSYFQSDINFQRGNFEKAIELAQKQLPKSTPQEKSELNKIIGESYFNLKEYQEAIPYLEQYNGKEGRWSNTDFYQLGYAYFKEGQYEKAIAQFDKIIEGKNAIVQNAYYHLGESYVKLDKKSQALNAFKNASEMDFKPEITEDALLNYAKLSYDIGNGYEPVPKVLDRFLRKYPKSPQVSQISMLLLDAYVDAGEYEKALSLLEKRNAPEDRGLYQKVAFMAGQDLFAQKKYKEAKTMFRRSISHNQDPVFAARATYWEAESDYNLEDYKEASVGYRQFKGMAGAKRSPELKYIDYNIGYAYFNQKDYKPAIRYFEGYLASAQKEDSRKTDALLRLGDSYFAESEYWKAMEQYNKVKDRQPDNDYAYFQKALSYGFVDRNENKIKGLEDFVRRFPHSNYHADALYELGNTYMNEHDNKKALDTYQKVVSQHPKSKFEARALLRQGLIYYNENHNEEALKKFQRVATDFPNSEEANQAISSVRNIYVDSGNIREYATWVKSLGYDLSDMELDNANYESAENKLLGSDDTAAITAFQKYLKQFPKGSHALSAHYHLAQLFYKENDKKAAIPHYEYVIDQSHNDFTEKSLERLSRVYLDEQEKDKAKRILIQLEENGNAQNITFARSNLMKIYYDESDYAKTVAYAEKVLADSQAEARAKDDAEIFIARSALKTGALDKAKEAYAKVKERAQGELAAEAQYYDAYFKREEGEYKASNESAQRLATDFSTYQKWGVKGLILMAKNYNDLEDAFNATYILQNVVDNFGEFPEEVREARQLLKKLKAKAAKTNSSVKLEHVLDSLSN